MKENMILGKSATFWDIIPTTYLSFLSGNALIFQE